MKHILQKSQKRENTTLRNSLLEDAKDIHVDLNIA